MKRIPRLLATTLIFALLNVSYINLALASSAAATSPKAIPSTAAQLFVSDSLNVAEEEEPPCSKKVDKACIKSDLDKTRKDTKDLIGPDNEGFLADLFDQSGLDPDGDLEDAKKAVDDLSDADFDAQQEQWDKAHKKFNKRHKKMAAILANKELLAILHRRWPGNLRVVVSSAPAGTTGTQRVFFSPVKDTGRSFPSMKPATNRGAFATGLTGLNITVMPEFTHTCNPGAGLTNGISDLAIAKGITLALELAKEVLLEDIGFGIPKIVATTAWGIARLIDFALEVVHQTYLECKAAQQEHNVEVILDEIKKKIDTSNTDIKTTLTEVNNSKTEIINTKTEVTNVKNEVNNIKNEVFNIKNYIDQSVTNITSNVQGNTQTAIDNSTTQITGSVSTALTNTEKNLNKSINDNGTAIINNAAINAANSLRLMIEADLSEPDSSVPIGLFMTPSSKGGYLELVRTIVFETIRNLTGATIAQANTQLASADSLVASGKYKAAYAALRKAYKTATG